MDKDMVVKIKVRFQDNPEEAVHRKLHALLDQVPCLRNEVMVSGEGYTIDLKNQSLSVKELFLTLLKKSRIKSKVCFKKE